TAFEKIPILQVLTEFTNTEQPEGCCKQLNLF
ncbi:unnamed protein product, partial [marine sediment metagenome]